MSIVDVTCEFDFEAAHFLPLVDGTHKCKRMHGHSYKVAVTVTGYIERTGMVLDYAEIKSYVRPIIEKLDHQVLNDFIDNPTCENLCVRLWGWLAPYIAVSAITVRETSNAYCTYKGEERG